jgi:toxin YoeB
MKAFNVTFADGAMEEYQWFVDNDKKTARRIVKLVENIRKNPFKGIGKPEPLKHQFSKVWSRRIDAKNRLMYWLIDKDTVEILACIGHYGKK